MEDGKLTYMVQESDGAEREVAGEWWSPRITGYPGQLGLPRGLSQQGRWVAEGKLLYMVWMSDDAGGEVAEVGVTQRARQAPMLGRGWEANLRRSGVSDLM